jgi:predicted transcriptional regulator
LMPFDGRRSSVQLISEILRLLRLGEASKTEVMYGVRLTHSQTLKYLLRLAELRLVDRTDDDGKAPVYRITAKGLDILGKIEQVQEMLRVDELPEILDSPRLQVQPEQDRKLLGRVKDAIVRRRHQSQG